MNISQETYDFLVLTDPVIICIYLRTTDRHLRDPGNIRHRTSELLICDLVQTVNTFRNLSLWIFAAGKASLVYLSIGKRKRTPIRFVKTFYKSIFSTLNSHKIENQNQNISNFQIILKIHPKYC